MYVMYRPLRVFVLIGSALSIMGLVPIGFYFVDGGAGHIQSLVIGGTRSSLDS